MRVAVVATAICLSIVGLADAQDAKAAMRMPTNIPAQSLGPALKAFAQQRDLQVLYFSETVRNLRTGGASGQLTADEALTQLLSGTGLVYRYVDDKAVTILASGAAGPTLPTRSDERHGASEPKEGKNNSSGDFRVAQLDQGANSGVATVGPGKSGSQTAREPMELEEIVVTAQKRAERLIDTPQSVSVLSADDIDKLSAVQFRDFANTVPGLNFATTGAGYTQISLRGVTAGFDVGSTVGTYVDDVPYGSSSGFAQGGQIALDVGLFDMDRIEILRGPQGTLYGASTMGGLIKYVTKQPDMTGLSGEVQTGVSTTQDGGISYIAAGAMNAPLVADKLAMRASTFYSRDGGYIDNIARGQSDVNRSGIYGGRLDLLVALSDALTVRVGGFLQDISRDGESTADYTLAGTPVYGELDQYRLFAEPFEQHFRLGSATVAYDFGPMKLSSISSYQTSRTQLTYDVTGAYLQFCSVVAVTCSAVGLPQELTTNKVTQEVRLASNGVAQLEWLVGGFFTHESSDNRQSFSLRDLAGQASPAVLYEELNSSTYQEYAAFLDLTYHLTDRFDFSGGVRYSRDRQSFTQNGAGPFSTTTPASESTESVATYLANARYHFSSNTTGYVRYATGYRPGGPNFTLRDPATGLPVGPPTFGPDKLKSYEAGIKAESADRQFSIDFASYYIDWKDIRIAVARNNFSGIENAAGATIRGAELTLTAHPIREFAVTGAFAYQNARLSADAPDIGGTNGERLPNVPRFTGAINGDYYLPVERLRPTIGATLRYVTDRTASYDNALFIKQYRMPAYTTLDLRTGLTLGSIGVQLYVHNLFDERGQLSAFAAYSPSGETKVSILQPRTLGITATTHF